MLDTEGNEVVEEGGEQEPKVDETKYIPIDRFNQVYKQAKDYERMMADYKKYGTPDEVRSRHEKLTQWEKAVEEAKKQAAATPDEKKEAERAARVRKELEAMYPELKQLSKIGDLEQKYEGLSAQEAEATAKGVLSEHSATLAPILKAAGIDAKHQSKIEEYLISQMGEDQKIAFLNGDFDVAKQIFDSDLKEGLLSALVRKPAPILPALRNPAGGTAAKGAKPKPLSMKEAEDIGWAKLQE